MPIKVCPGCEGCRFQPQSPNQHPCVSCHRCWDYATQDNYVSETSPQAGGKECHAPDESQFPLGPAGA